MAGQGSAVVVGVGPGLGAALGRRFAKEGLNVALAARNPEKTQAISSMTPTVSRTKRIGVPIGIR